MDDKNFISVRDMSKASDEVKKRMGDSEFSTDLFNRRLQEEEKRKSELAKAIEDQHNLDQEIAQAKRDQIIKDQLAQEETIRQHEEEVKKNHLKNIL